MCCTLNTCFSPIQDMLSAWSISKRCWMLWGEIEEVKSWHLPGIKHRVSGLSLSHRQRMNEAFSTTTINIEDCDCLVVVWWLELNGGSQKPWDQFLSTGWCFTFLPFASHKCFYFRSLFTTIYVRTHEKSMNHVFLYKCRPRCYSQSLNHLFAECTYILALKVSTKPPHLSN